MSEFEFEIDTIIVDNRRVDPENLNRTLTALKELRKRGVESAKYNLELPFSKNQSPSPKEQDSRLVHLRK